MESRFMVMRCTVGARVIMPRSVRLSERYFALSPPQIVRFCDLRGIRDCQDTLLAYARRHVVVSRLKQGYEVSMKSLSPVDLKPICWAESFSMTFMAPPQRGQRQVAGGWGERCAAR
jgi:hypothetical protein